MKLTFFDRSVVARARLAVQYSVGIWAFFPPPLVTVCPPPQLVWYISSYLFPSFQLYVILIIFIILDIRNFKLGELSQPGISTIARPQFFLPISPRRLPINRSVMASGGSETERGGDSYFATEIILTNCPLMTLFPRALPASGVDATRPATERGVSRALVSPLRWETGFFYLSLSISFFAF